MRRVFGDLNEPERRERVEFLGPGTAGTSENPAQEQGSPSRGDIPRHEDKPSVGPSELMDLQGQDSGKDPIKVAVGGSPPAEPPAHVYGSLQPTERARERVGEQGLEPPVVQDDRTPRRWRSSTGGLWFVLMVLLLLVLGVSSYLYLRLRADHIAVSQVPELLRSINPLVGRMQAAEAKLNHLTANWDGLAYHVAEIDRKLDSALRATRDQTRELVEQANKHLQAELDQRGSVVDARLNQVESMQRRDQAQLAELNEQLRVQVTSLRQELTAAQESDGRDLATLQQQVSGNRDDLRSLDHRLHREKVTFEVVKNSPTEVAPGITLTVLNTNVSHQRFRGYISLINEGKTLWLDNLHAKQAVDLYAQQTNHPYSLVVTTINDHGVSGYLLLPASA